MYQRLCLASLLAGSCISSAFAVDYSTPDNYQTYRRAPGTSAQATQRRAPLPKSPSSQTSNKDPDFDFTMGVDTGYRRDNMHWNIAAEPTGTVTPNILSELKWKNVNGVQARPYLSYTQTRGTFQGFHIEGSAAKSATIKGKNQDSDYFGDNRSQEFSRSNNHSDGGGADAFDVGVGYAFNFSPDRKRTLARFIALVGYSYNSQDFTMSKGNQTLATNGITPDLGPFAGLDSSYTMKWRAPFIGAEAVAFLTDRQRLKLGGRYYKGQYNGEANWNLRDDFAHPVSFRHKADADGFSLSAEYGWQFIPQWELKLSAIYDQFKTDPGTDTTYFFDGTSASTRLNEVKWTSQQYMAGINYTF